jgi:deoxyribonuclease (pyrimidine dimer)
MTRINAGIHPSRLLDTHLFSEWRELPRIFTMVKEGRNKSKPPAKFSLGTGHVCFFYDKLTYLYDRYLMIVRELNIREMSYDEETTESVLTDCNCVLSEQQFVHHWNDWYDADAEEILIERISEKIQTMTDGKFRYRKEKVTRDFALNLLLEKHK